MTFSRRQFLKRGLAVGTSAAATGTVIGMTAGRSALAGDSLGNVHPDIPRSRPGIGDFMHADDRGTQRSDDGDRFLRLWNVQTDEYYEGLYWTSGRFLPAALDQLSYLMRDFRIGEARPMDPYVIDFMHDIYQRLDTTEPLHILSGYRSEQTNRALAQESTEVARNSLHIQGKAIDFRMPGTPARTLSKFARKSARGGVGYYEKRDFIHIDTGSPRFWERELF